MDRIWAAWRMAYVGGKPAKRCLFCTVAPRPVGRVHGTLVKTGRALVMLNAFPYNTGHVMVVPRRHAASLSELTAAERSELMELVERTERAVRRAYQPEGLNVGMNLGRCAGAGIPGHLHVHVLPRWNGDTNFMPALAGTKVMPESLATTWKRLRQGFKEEA